MIDLPDDINMLITIGAGLVVKVLLSTSMTAAKIIAASTAGVFVAWVFTDPIIGWVGMDPLLYRVPLAALLALTGEQIVRRLIRYSDKPDELLADIIKFRGGK